MEYNVQTMEMGGGDEQVEWNQITIGDFRLMAEDRTFVGVSLNLLSYFLEVDSPACKWKRGTFKNICVCLFDCVGS